MDDLERLRQLTRNGPWGPALAQRYGTPPEGWGPHIRGLLTQAIAKQSEWLVEAALLLPLAGTEVQVVPLLRELLLMKWHHSQEEIAAWLGDHFLAPENAPYLFLCAREAAGRPLFVVARRCVFALGKLETLDAVHRLGQLLEAEAGVVRRTAKEQLERRIECGPEELAAEARALLTAHESAVRNAPIAVTAEIRRLDLWCDNVYWNPLPEEKDLASLTGLGGVVSPDYVEFISITGGGGTNGLGWHAPAEAIELTNRLLDSGVIEEGYLVVSSLDDWHWCLSTSSGNNAVRVYGPGGSWEAASGFLELLHEYVLLHTSPLVATLLLTETGASGFADIVAAASDLGLKSSWESTAEGARVTLASEDDGEFACEALRAFASLLTSLAARGVPYAMQCPWSAWIPAPERIGSLR